jgi:hypothetical protein
MTKDKSVVAIFKSHTGAESAVKELQQSGFDMKKLSIVGQDYHTTKCGRLLQHRRPHEILGKTGRLLGWFLGPVVWFRVLCNSRCRTIAHGRADCRLDRRSAGRRGGGGRSERIGRRPLQHGHPQDSILQYETAVKSGKYVLIAHGTDIESAHARNIINRANPEALAEHQPACATNEACAVGS